MNNPRAAMLTFHSQLLLRLTAASVPLLTLASAQLMAEEAIPESNIEEILVIGQGAALDNAIRKQRMADSIKSVVSSDAVAQLPDENVAEAVQRLPGISIERDQGEGRFVSVRGLAPDLNSVQINGTTIPSPNSDTRAVALDVIPSELVETLSVVKAVTPDMDANSLGGSIEVESLSGFDHQGRFYTFSGDQTYDDNTEQYSGKLSGAVSDQFSLGGAEDNLAVALAFSWEQRDFGSDNVETGGGWDFDQGARLEETEMRDYEITRERTGLGLNLDYKIGNGGIFLHSLYSEFTDTETRNAAGVEFSDPVAAGDSADAEAWRELKSREETQKIESYVLGGDWALGNWTFNAQAGYSESSEETPEHIAGAEFASNDDFTNVSFGNSRRPTVVAAAAFYDAGAYSLDKVKWEQQYTSDTEQNIKLDLARDYVWSGMAAQLKLGAKLSQREKDNDANAWKYKDFSDYGIGDQQLLLSGYAGSSVDYSLGDFGPSINASGVRSLLAGLNKNEFYNEEDSRIEDFVMDEDITSAYLMNTLDQGPLRVIVGLRFEATDFSAEGTGLTDGDYQSVSADNDYQHWLPGAHLRYQLGDNTQLRAAWTNTVVRPSFEQLAPGFVIDDDEAAFGNPQLDPLESSNIDLGIEHYLGRAGIASAFFFYKDISNFIYQTDLAGQGEWLDFSEAETFANGDSATLYGLELTWSQQLGQLPAPWNGLLVGANLTVTHSDARIGSGANQRDINLPFQSDQVGNAMIGWENEKLSVRLSANYKSSLLSEVAFDDPQHDEFVDSQTYVDLTANYYLTDQLRLNFEAHNITDESYYVYTGRSAFNTQYEEYGPSFKLGITFVSM
ncbi:TonB-dependent receptor [Halioxenophilus sp. WMMB6]|uniref:TonB-dependent receptor n=1 Tax=Halioxenophilus sp. WMMB6 TaxID=3073815 RepID=UPI00295EB145|nr:TonB-dependent receptor [Halioxenophilus sp. WMMB6]